MCLEYGTKSWKGHFKKGKAIQSDSSSVSLSVATIACTPQNDDSSSTEHTFLLSTLHEVQGSGLNYGFIINALVFLGPIFFISSSPDVYCSPEFKLHSTYYTTFMFLFFNSMDSIPLC